MNKAMITFVYTDLDNTVYTKVVRIEFEGSPEQFVRALNFYNGTMLSGEAEAFNVVNVETLVSSWPSV
jgi:hypothetical protein